MTPPLQGVDPRFKSGWAHFIIAYNWAYTMAETNNFSLDDFAARYHTLQERYNLPTLDELNFEFEIKDIIVEKKAGASFPLRYVRRIMINVLSSWTNHLHGYLMPNPQSAIHVHESKQFTDDDKERINQLITKIMLFNRLSTKLDLTHDEKKDADFIKSVYTEWIDIKKFIIEFADITIQSWEKDVPNDKKPNHLIG